jgi:sporulation-control protein
LSLFKKISANLLGIGGAQVDTILDESTYRPGDLVTGKVHVLGGEVAQEIDDMDLYVMANYQLDSGYSQSIKIYSHRVLHRFTISPSESRSFPFQFQLPIDTPISLRTCTVWIKTNLDIKYGLDAKDNDQIVVQPHPWIEKMLRVMGQRKFELRIVDCEYAPFLKRRLPFIQEFEFRPDFSCKYIGKLKEIECIFFLEEKGMEILLEIDRKAREVNDWKSSIDVWVRVHLSDLDLQRSEDELANLLDQTIEAQIKR